MSPAAGFYMSLDAVRRQPRQVGAVCGKAACTDLRGGPGQPGPPPRYFVGVRRDRAERGWSATVKGLDTFQLTLAATSGLSPCLGAGIPAPGSFRELPRDLPRVISCGACGFL
jgi:hypothetical protein